jgi:hypothetical protein
VAYHYNNPLPSLNLNTHVASFIQINSDECDYSKKADIIACKEQQEKVGSGGANYVFLVEAYFLIFI